MQLEDFELLSEISGIVKCIAESGDALTVAPGQYYRVLPDKAEEHGMLRAIDNTGEDYLYAASSFETVDDLNRPHAECSGQCAG